MASSNWAACPPQILSLCFTCRGELAYNTACACVCKSWQEGFLSNHSELRLHYGLLRPPPGPAYLRQFTGLNTLTLHDGTFWSHEVTERRSTSAFPAWVQHQREASRAILRSIPSSCSQLSLVNTLCPQDNFCVNFDGRQLSHLTKLQHLAVHSGDHTSWLAHSLSVLSALKVLQLQNRRLAAVRQQSLSSLPSCITRLELEHIGKQKDLWELDDLMRLQSLRDLSLHACWLRADPIATVPPAITRLVLTSSVGNAGVFQITHMSTLQVLDLCNFGSDDGTVALRLGDLLSSVPCLHELDIRDSDITVASQEILQQMTVKVFSMTCWQRSESFLGVVRQIGPQAHTDLLNFADVQVQVCKCLDASQHGPVAVLPGYALTSLYLQQVRGWPDRLFSASFWAQHKLQVLYIQFSVCPLRTTMVLSPGCCLKQLYLTKSRATMCDLAACISLTALGIQHMSVDDAVLVLPSSLLSMNLISVAACITMPQLEGCVGLTHVLLGGDLTSYGIGRYDRQLPALPQTVTHLTLWNAHITGLQQLTSLTNLRKLRMPRPPTQQQLLIIKQLRQLTDLEIMHQGVPSGPL